MMFLARLTLIASLFGLLAAGLCHTRPAWLADLGLDIWSFPEIMEKAEEQRERGRQLNARLVRTQERMRLKQEATADLIAGRRSLREVAFLFRKLSDHIPAFEYHLCETWPEQSDTGRLCRYVIRSVEWVLLDEPEKAREVVVRLERELSAQLHQ